MLQTSETGQKLANLRREASLTQTFLAKKLDLNSSSLSRVESGERVPTPAIIHGYVMECGKALNWDIAKTRQVEQEMLAAHLQSNTYANVLQSSSDTRAAPQPQNFTMPLKTSTQPKVGEKIFTKIWLAIGIVFIFASGLFAFDWYRRPHLRACIYDADDRAYVLVNAQVVLRSGGKLTEPSARLQSFFSQRVCKDLTYDLAPDKQDNTISVVCLNGPAHGNCNVTLSINGQMQPINKNFSSVTDEYTSYVEQYRLTAERALEPLLPPIEYTTAAAEDYGLFVKAKDLVLVYVNQRLVYAATEFPNQEVQFFNLSQFINSNNAFPEVQIVLYRFDGSYEIIAEICRGNTQVWAIEQRDVGKKHPTSHVLTLLVQLLEEKSSGKNCSLPSMLGFSQP